MKSKKNKMKMKIISETIILKIDDFQLQHEENEIRCSEYYMRKLQQIRRFRTLM